MWRWAVLWQASALLIVGATLDFRFFTRQRNNQPSQQGHKPMSNCQVNCFEMPKYSMDSYARTFNAGWRYPRRVGQIYNAPTSPTIFSQPLLNLNELSPRIDRLLPEADDIVKEHAKLVQDINSLKQVVFVSPFLDENRDYDDSIFHDFLETTTHLPKTTTKPPPKTTKSSSIPIVLLGGASSQRQVVKSQPLKFPKSSISLVGTSVSPLAKHPYPFVVQGSSQRPLRVCMSTAATAYTTRRPSLWERLLSAIIPR